MTEEEFDTNLRANLALLNAGILDSDEYIKRIRDTRTEFYSQIGLSNTNPCSEIEFPREHLYDIWSYALIISEPYKMLIKRLN